MTKFLISLTLIAILGAIVGLSISYMIFLNCFPDCPVYLFGNVSGSIKGTSNLLSFVGALLFSGIYLVINSFLGNENGK